MRFIRRCSARLCRIMLIVSCGSVAFGLTTLAAHAPVVLIVFAAGAAYRTRRRWQPSEDSHGSSNWASMNTLARGGLLGDDGLILGRAGYADPIPRWRALMGMLNPSVRSDIACTLFFHSFFNWRRGSRRMIRLQRMIHCATFAPAGKGKGVSVLIPNLLSYRGSVVVTDPKGELAIKTGDHRRRKFSHRVITLDPYHIAGENSGSINPLSAIDPAADSFLDDCRDLANALVMRAGTEHEPHWNDCAELVLCAFIALTVAYEKDKRLCNLQMVRRLVSSRDAFINAVSLMQKFEEGSVIKRLGDQLSWFQDKELNSVLTHVQRHTNFLDSPSIQAITQESSFQPAELRRGDVSIFLILPPERLVTLAPLMRMWLNWILRGLTRGQASEQSPVLFLLDEAAHLGKLQIIEDAVTLMRGYGIRLWFFFQSIDQLNKCFGDHAPTILENLDTQQHFGISSFEAAEELSKRMGDTTIAVTSGSETDGRSVPTGPSAQGPTPGSRSSSTTVSYSMTGRRLAFASELITAGDDFQLIFTRNLPPIPATLLRYHEAPEFRWGGTGRQDGLGLRGLTAAFVVMLISLMAPPFFATVSPMLRNGFEHPTAMQAPDGQPGVYEPDYSSGAYRPSPYRSPSYRSRRYGGMGGMSRYSR
jgi:type IV secretion system protein VirD4